MQLPPRFFTRWCLGVKLTPLKFTALAVTAAALTAGCVSPSGSVTRVARGIEYQGREISDTAYAAYALGALWEVEGHLEAALAAYVEALREDADAPELLARVGAVRCKLGRRPGDALRARAERDFERALRRDPDSALVLEELSRCQALSGQHELAYRTALEAAARDPESEKLSLWVASTAQAAGNTESARIWLDATVTWRPDSLEAWQAFNGYATKQRDRIRILRAENALARLGRARLDPARFQAPRDTQRLPPTVSTGSHIRSTDIAVPVRVAAERAFAANPDDAEAWVTLLLAAHHEQRREDFEVLLRQAPREPSPLSANAFQRVAQLIEHLVGPAARRLWDGNR